MQPEWRQLELLRYVIDSGGIAQGAKAAGVSQPAVSQAMQRLAAAVGEPLFELHGRQLVPNAKALKLAHAMRSAEESFRRISDTTTTDRQSTDGDPHAIRIGLSPAAGLLYSPEIVQTVISQRGRTRLSIITGTAPVMLDALKRDELELVIAPRPRGLSRIDLAEHLMYVSEPVIYCRKGHPLASTTSLRAVARAQWVMAGHAGTPGNMVEEAFRVRRWAPPRIAVHCADYAMLVQIVSETDLLGVLPHPRLVPPSRQADIVPLRVAERLPHYDVCLFWSRRIGRNARAVRKLIATLSDATREALTP